MKYTIAIDGPAASGKSSTAEAIAKRLRFERLDSGMLYRAITFLIYEKFNDFDEKSPNILDFVNSIRLEQKNGRMLYENRDITDYLRTADVDSKVGLVARQLFVRRKTFEMQQDILRKFNALDNVSGIVVDGRDIGTVVLPNAFLKLYITAEASKRAERRSKQTGEDFDAVLEEIERRDSHDTTREHGRLVCADDAILIDNGLLTLDQTVDMIIEIFNRKVDSL